MLPFSVAFFVSFIPSSLPLDKNSHVGYLDVQKKKNSSIALLRALTNLVPIHTKKKIESAKDNARFLKSLTPR